MKIETKKCAICGEETIYEMGGVPLCFDCLSELDKICKDEIGDIIRRVCSFTHVSPITLQVKTRKPRIIIARQLATYIAYNLDKWSLSYIGSKIGHKDHATVLHSVHVIENYLEVDKTFQNKYKDLLDLYK